MLVNVSAVLNDYRMFCQKDYYCIVFVDCCIKLKIAQNLVCVVEFNARHHYKRILFWTTASLVKSSLIPSNFSLEVQSYLRKEIR